VCSGEVGKRTPATGWRVVAFVCVMAKLLALCTLSSGSEAELAFGTKGGGESEESRSRSNILGFVPREGDHNGGGFFVLPLLRFG